MITGIDIANFCIASMGLTISIMGLLLSSHAEFMEVWFKKFFTTTFSIIILYVISDFASQISLILLGPEFGPLSKAAVFFESLFSSVLMPLLTVCILHICSQPIRSRFHFFNIGLWVLYFILLVYTQFTETIYYITPDNVYRRGPLYPLLLFPPILLMVSNLVGVYVRRNNMSRQYLHSLVLYIIIPMVSMVIQIFSYGLLLIVLGTSISAMIVFLYIMNDQIAKDIDNSRKISAQQLTIRTLQMRPHFIYNTLSNIYYLCAQNPQKAQAAVDDFTKYLRKNFTAITKEDLIPFEEELEHARAYLAVVKVRYEEMLFVDYKTEFTTFRVPPLTLEPIVENSVKHGLDPEAAPLHIMISTKREKDHVLITVEDTGKGYDLDEANEADIDKNSGDIHIGLSNVKSRLSEMCNGTLEISTRQGGGTIVSITIPVA